MEIVIAWLQGHLLEVNASSVDANRCTRLHATHRDSVLGDAFREVKRGRFGTASASQFRAADVHKSVEEGSCCDDDAARQEGHAEIGLDARNTPVLDEEFPYLILPDAQVRLVLNHLSPSPDKASPVALGARTPHGRPFRAVEHAELYGGLVRNLAHVSA